MSDKPTPDEQRSTELALLVKGLRENLPAHMELAELQARIARKKYLALVAAGFSKDEALQLCR